MGVRFRDKIRTLYRTLAIKIVLLTIVFLVVPIIFYRLFQIADTQQTKLLQTTVEQEGNLIASVLRPHLINFRDESPEELQRALDDLAGDGANIKVFLRPMEKVGSSGFLYVASTPAVPADYLDQERRKLTDMGVLGRLTSTCDYGPGAAVRFTNPAGKLELLTSMTPEHVGKDCWVVITSQATQALLSTSIGQPVWRTPTIRVAALVYLLSAVIVAWLLVEIWRNIDRFRMAARQIRFQGASEVSFRELNTIPELTGVADDFDALVAALKQSKDFIVQAAEENAHALKAPLAVIAQAIEPLKRATPVTDQQARRSLDLIERSTARLDLLVSASRDLGHVAADVIYPASRRINLAACISQLIAAYETTLIAEGKFLHSEIERDVYVYASEEAMESIVENLLENAASFTERGETIEVLLRVSGEYAQLTVADHGPGVPPDHLPQIFERYFSARSRTQTSPSVAVPSDQHYGLGLWIVRRNVEGFGGMITASNRDGGGFAVTVGFRTTD
jgi:two-component system sensor histidine kinase ChvG